MTYRDLAIQMVTAFEKLGNSQYARIDARAWHEHYAKKLLKLDRAEQRKAKKP